MDYNEAEHQQITRKPYNIIEDTFSKRESLPTEGRLGNPGLCRVVSVHTVHCASPTCGSTEFYPLIPQEGRPSLPGDLFRGILLSSEPLQGQMSIQMSMQGRKESISKPKRWEKKNTCNNNQNKPEIRLLLQYHTISTLLARPHN